MKMNNSFKQLGKEEEERYPHPPPETELGIMGNVRVFNFMSNVLELYLPRVFEMFISLVGGTTEATVKQPDNNGTAREDNGEIPNGEPK